MRNFLILVMMTFVSHHSLCQNNVNALTENSIEASLKMFSIYNLDVLRYFDIHTISPLKLKVFKESDEYRRIYSQMLKKKNDLFKYSFYIKKSYNRLDYNLERKVIPNQIGGNCEMNFEYSNPPKSVVIDRGSMDPFKYRSVVFDNLPVYKSYLHTLNIVYGEYLLFPMTEAVALRIEDSKNSLHIYYFFNINKVSNVTYPFYKTTLSLWKGRGNNKREEVLKTENVSEQVFNSNELRVIIADDEGTIYYSKDYTKEGPFPFKASTEEEKKIIMRDDR